MTAKDPFADVNTVMKAYIADQIRTALGRACPCCGVPVEYSKDGTELVHV